MIILEGPDNAGKTTLGEYLAKQLQTTVRHSERPDPKWNPVECLAHSSRQLRPQRAILDRVYAISEPVYGPICRGQSSLGDQGAKAILDLYHRPYLIIYCRPPSSVILKNDGREQMDGVIDNHAAIIAGYDKIMTDIAMFSRCTVVRYDWTNRTSLPQLVETCKRHLLKFDQAIWSSTWMA
ncbi:thymidylate kinase [Pseudomonas phage PMBT14]|uniref:Thymidylate kinase n=1 Tax=Pseudomonas phage PMBT14 TaxID=2059855 RepID=A0A2I6PI82_9CAUD|nr:thymidylate kinase [Pseudomonas phage PMBT14]AUM59768.1 thymidylate kinase [Pseudomonas phage PMBT14]